MVPKMQCPNSFHLDVNSALVKRICCGRVQGGANASVVGRYCNTDKHTAASKLQGSVLIEPQPLWAWTRPVPHWEGG